MIDPSQLEFCRVLYDFNPELVGGGGTGATKLAGSNNTELSVKKGDLVAVLSKLDPMTGGPSEWWKCRTRDGRVGWLPGVWMEVIPRQTNPASASATSAAGEVKAITNSTTSLSGDGSGSGGVDGGDGITNGMPNGNAPIKTREEIRSALRNGINERRKREGNTRTRETGADKGREDKEGRDTDIDQQRRDEKRERKKEELYREWRALKKRSAAGVVAASSPVTVDGGRDDGAVNGGLWSGVNGNVNGGVFNGNGTATANGSTNGSTNSASKGSGGGEISVDGFRKSSFYNQS